MLTLSPVSRLDATKRMAAFAVNGPVPTRLRSMLRGVLREALLIRSTCTKVRPSREKNTVTVSLSAPRPDRWREPNRPGLPRRAGQGHGALDLRTVEIGAGAPEELQHVVVAGIDADLASGCATAVTALGPIGIPIGRAVGVALARSFEIVDIVRRGDARAPDPGCRRPPGRSAYRRRQGRGSGRPCAVPLSGTSLPDVPTMMLSALPVANWTFSILRSDRCRRAGRRPHARR